MLFRKKRGTYIGSTVVPTSSSLHGNDLGVMGVFFPENCDKTDKVGAEISDSLKFGILGLY